MATLQFPSPSVLGPCGKRRLTSTSGDRVWLAQFGSGVLPQSYELRLRVLGHVIINMANGLFPLVNGLREGDVIWTNLLKYVYH